MSAVTFAAVGLALYVAHHVGDYWVQTDGQAQRKGLPGGPGRFACLGHVLTYVLTQAAMLGTVMLVTGLTLPVPAVLIGLLVSGAAHYLADRREPLKRMASWLPGKSRFVMLGAPRPGVEIEVWEDCETCGGTGAFPDESTGGKCWDCRGGGVLPVGKVGDNPTLGTGLWALDQSWHVLTSVFVPALIITGLS